MYSKYPLNKRRTNKKKRTLPNITTQAKKNKPATTSERNTLRMHLGWKICVGVVVIAIVLGLAIGMGMKAKQSSPPSKPPSPSPEPPAGPPSQHCTRTVSSGDVEFCQTSVPNHTFYTTTDAPADTLQGNLDLCATDSNCEGVIAFPSPGQNEPPTQYPVQFEPNGLPLPTGSADAYYSKIKEN